MTRITLLIGMLISLAACNAEIKGSGDPIPAPVQEKGVDGPVVEGTWTSACTIDPFTSSGFKKLEVQFAGNNVTRSTLKFADSQCTTSTDSKVEKGTFIFSENLGNGYYTIKYTIDLGNGWSSLPTEKIYIDAKYLYLSNYMNGDTVDITNMVALERKSQLVP